MSDSRGSRGIGDYDTVLFPDPAAFEQWRHVTITPARLVAMGLAEPRTGAPGERWSYSNTNYILAGDAVRRSEHPACRPRP